jgi:PleD family two-component response regulator
MVTVSLGTASTDVLPGMSVEGIISQADDALYMAKHEGRNCIRSSMF